jgi:hypothetical protein
MFRLTWCDDANISKGAGQLLASDICYINLLLDKLQASQDISCRVPHQSDIQRVHMDDTYPPTSTPSLYPAMVEELFPVRFTGEQSSTVRQELAELAIKL